MRQEAKIGAVLVYPEEEGGEKIISAPYTPALAAFIVDDLRARGRRAVAFELSTQIGSGIIDISKLRLDLPRE